MMENNNFSFKTGGISPSRQIQINPNNINIDYQALEPNSSNLQDIVQNQKKMHDDIITLSSNLNLNFDVNENNNNLNANKNSKEDDNRISSNLNPTKNELSNEKQHKTKPDSTRYDFNQINGEQSKKLNELINKFNYLYSSDNSEEMKIYNINNKNHFKEEKEYIIHDYNTINNDDIKERNNFENNNVNNISLDKIV